MRAVHLTRVGLKSKARVLDQMVWLIEKVAKFIMGMCNVVPYGPRLFSEKYGVGNLFQPIVFTGLAHSDAFLVRIIISFLLFWNGLSVQINANPKWTTVNVKVNYLTLALKIQIVAVLY
jgi:hypothetical protein